jgi:trehalose 6-phosphate synthase/phosphatase
VARRFTDLVGPADFQFAAGDDRTDEDLFQALDETAWTVHVGPGRSRARFAIPAPSDVITMLQKMAGAEL